ncbi:transposase [Streptomyces vinaceus]|uniref:transposase n=1 Tax=Streptomyces vinaceus TaxID=1960 RepID=UPI0036A051BE
MAELLGHEAENPAGWGRGNIRNGSYGKTVTTTTRPVAIKVPRDRRDEFEPRIVPRKGRCQRRDCVVTAAST